MADEAENPARNTSFYYDYYQHLFEVADVTSFFWQPTLKAIGRTQLEFAALQARQTRAWMHWAHQLMRPTTPEDIFNANAQLWGTMMREYIETAPRVAAAVETAADAAVPAVLQLPPKPARDTLILLDRDEPAVSERKVA